MRNYFKIILFAVAPVFFLSCDEDEKKPITCDVVDPAENLPWLKTKIESFEEFPTIYEYMYVQQGVYSNQTVFIFGNCCPFCDSYFPIFNCAGEELEGINIQEITDIKVIWIPLGSQCTF